jgi:hypothetical protein
MINQKNNQTKTTKTPADAPQPGEKPLKQGLVIKSDYRTESFEHWPRPSELELAALAARLARAEQIDPKRLVDEAWDLYRASCQKIQQDHLEVERVLAAWEAVPDDGPFDDGSALPQPEQYPITFQAMELLLLPKLKGRTAERAALMREYIFAELLGQCFDIRNGFKPVSYWNLSPANLEIMREQLKPSIVKKFGLWRASLYDAQAYAKFAAAFLQWHGQWTNVRNSEIKAANAIKGWEKRRKAKTAKTGPRPKLAVLKEIMEPPTTGA